MRMLSRTLVAAALTATSTIGSTADAQAFAPVAARYSAAALSTPLQQPTLIREMTRPTLSTLGSAWEFSADSGVRLAAASSALRRPLDAAVNIVDSAACSPVRPLARSPFQRCYLPRPRRGANARSRVVRCAHWEEASRGR